MKNWKTWLPWLIAAVAVIVCLFVVFREDDSGSSGSKSGNYTGRYELKQIVGDEDTYDKTDFEEWGIEEGEQYIILNKDGTGVIAITVDGGVNGVRRASFKFTYDESERTGYAYDDRGNVEFEFTVKNGKLKFEGNGVQWVFEK